MSDLTNFSIWHYCIQKLQFCVSQSRSFEIWYIYTKVKIKQNSIEFFYLLNNFFLFCSSGNIPRESKTFFKSTTVLIIKFFYLCCEGKVLQTKNVNIHTQICLHTYKQKNIRYKQKKSIYYFFFFLLAHYLKRGFIYE